jgi:hypothetical protein
MEDFLIDLQNRLNKGVVNFNEEDKAIIKARSFYLTPEQKAMCASFLGEAAQPIEVQAPQVVAQAIPVAEVKTVTEEVAPAASMLDEEHSADPDWKR